ncbi:hypothetical protein CBR_g3827 [Chara braunii]|uniref:Uncharacterized protein n=1 Tax=Chara braunii TaxID=69332 RepID=A0A388KGG7_CHABU|nr:hypothetical protein CBR_g3827 [Chara braunii]|eukprot:GBG69129.1 hypothetical protein CBR_g3827 [Chara braunii]
MGPILEAVVPNSKGVGHAQGKSVEGAKSPRRRSDGRVDPAGSAVSGGGGGGVLAGRQPAPAAGASAVAVPQGPEPVATKVIVYIDGFDDYAGRPLVDALRSAGFLVVGPQDLGGRLTESSRTVYDPQPLLPPPPPPPPVTEPTEQANGGPGPQQVGNSTEPNDMKTSESDPAVIAKDSNLLDDKADKTSGGGMGSGPRATGGSSNAVTSGSTKAHPGGEGPSQTQVPGIAGLRVDFQSASGSSSAPGIDTNHPLPGVSDSSLHPSAIPGLVDPNHPPVGGESTATTDLATGNQGQRSPSIIEPESAQATAKVAIESAGEASAELAQRISGAAAAASHDSNSDTHAHPFIYPYNRFRAFTFTERVIQQQASRQPDIATRMKPD